MPFYRLPNGLACHINIGRRKAPPACREKRDDGTVCGWISSFQCDWKMGGGRTCDRNLCEQHAQEVAPNKHLCPEHQKEYEKWQSQHTTPSLNASPPKP